MDSNDNIEEAIKYIQETFKNGFTPDKVIVHVSERTLEEIRELVMARQVHKYTELDVDLLKGVDVPLHITYSLPIWWDNIKPLAQAIASSKTEADAIVAIDDFLDSIRLDVE